MKAIIITVITVIASTLCVNAQDQYVTSMKGKVNLRTAPSTTAAKAGSLSGGELLPLVEELDGWYKVDCNGKAAFVSQSVAATCDAVIPVEMYNKNLDSNGPLDKIRFQGDILIEPVDKTHVLVTVNWMRVNLPAETRYFLAEVTDGKIVATRGGMSYVEASSPLSEIEGELPVLEKPVRMGFDEFSNTIFFDGAEYSEFQ